MIFFWARSQYDIDDEMKSLKDDGPRMFGRDVGDRKSVVSGDIQKRLSHKALKSYSPVVQWATGRLMLILQWIIGLHLCLFAYSRDRKTTRAKEFMKSIL